MRAGDNDGYGDSTVALPIVAGGDCDDTMPMVSPGATEGPAGTATCSDTLDNDCDTFVDNLDTDCASARGKKGRPYGGGGTLGTKTDPARPVQQRDRSQ
jgi:hypothetical protein